MALGLSSCSGQAVPKAEPVSRLDKLMEWGDSGRPPITSSYDKRSDPRYQVFLAEYYGRSGKIRQALELYLQAVDSVPDRALIERGLEIAIYVSDFEAALTLSQKWLDVEPNSFPAHLSQLSNLVLLNRSSQASAELGSIFATFGFNDERYFRLRNRLFALPGVAVESIGSIAEAINSVKSRNGWWHLLLAETAIDGADLAKAARHADDAVAANPQSETAHQVRARIYFLADEPQRAESFLESALKGNSSFYGLRLMLARWLASEIDGKDESERKAARSRAIELIESIRAKREGLPSYRGDLYAQATHLLAFIYLSAEDYESNKPVLEDLANFSSYSEFANLSLAQLAIRDKKYRLAERYLSEVRTNEYQLTTLRLYVQVKIALKEWDEALNSIRYYRLRSQDEEGALNALLLEGEVYLKRHEYQRAFDLLSAGIKRFPESNSLKHSRSVAAHFLGRVDIIETDMRGILAMNPRDVGALNGLGYALACLTDRYAEAEELLSQALALEPENFAVIDSYGWLKFKKGDFKVADEYLHRSWEGMRDPEIAAHLVELYWARGEKDRARQFLLESDKEFPDNYMLKEVRGRLGL